VSDEPLLAWMAEAVPADAAVELMAAITVWQEARAASIAASHAASEARIHLVELLHAHGLEGFSL